MSLSVLHVIPAVSSRYGGPSTVALRTAAALRDLNARVLVATTDADGKDRLDVETSRETMFEGVPVMFFRREASEAFKWSPGLGRWLDAHVAEFDLVDVHAIFSHSSVAAGRACRRAGVPHVVRPHGALNPWGLGRRRWLKQVLFHVSARSLLAGAAAMQYTTAQERDLAERAFPWLPEGAVVPPGVEDACFEDSAPGSGGEPYILVLSRLAESKRLDALIDAFHRIAGRLPEPWRLIIAGVGDEDVVTRLRTLAANGPARAMIRFAGWVTGDAKRALLAGAGLLAAPSHQENFGLALVEAMAHGVPVLTSRAVDLAKDIEQHHAGWVVEEPLDALADTLAAVLASAEDRAARGAAARTFARQFRWSETGRRQIALYERMLTRSLIQAAETAPAGRP
ncbi:MAG: glycosyltransferase [Acidobacteriota bacterium]